ncbi:hypothetical protein D3C79_962400 [compost metagenome]
MNFIGRDFQRATVVREAVGDVHLGKLGDDGAAILIGEIAEQRAIVRLFRP